jgi:signal transduction histidine kinase
VESALRSLTAFQHVLFVALTGVGLARAVALGDHLAGVAALTVVLLGWYAAGVAGSRRVPTRSARDTRPTPGQTPRIRAVTVWWLLGVTVLWLGLVALSVEFVWVAFSLWLLAGHFLPWRWALPYAATVLAVVVAAPWHATRVLTLAQVVGPVIGAVFALIVSRGQVRLVRDGLERERLVASLVEAQAEAESLHNQLAATQRESGMLSERTRLSRDIHDTLAQGFSSILLLARTAEVTSDEPGLRDILRRIAATASANLDEARRVVGALAPRDLEGATLPASLRRLLDSFTEQTGIDGQLRVDGDLTALPTVVEVALVRTTQGALANVRRHAHASCVVVSLTETDDSVRLDIVDDGIGFDPAAVQARSSTPASGGYGLPSTRARLRELGGGLEIETAPGEGTALTAHVPIHPGRDR